MVFRLKQSVLKANLGFFIPKCILKTNRLIYGFILVIPVFYHINVR